MREAESHNLGGAVGRAQISTKISVSALTGRRWRQSARLPLLSAAMVRRKHGSCLLALSVVACSCAAAGAHSPLSATPAVILRRASASADGATLSRCSGAAGASCLRLKGGGRLNIDKREKTDVEMAEADAVTATLSKIISKNRPVVQESARFKFRRLFPAAVLHCVPCCLYLSRLLVNTPQDTFH